MNAGNSALRYGKRSAGKGDKAGDGRRTAKAASGAGTSGKDDSGMCAGKSRRRSEGVPHPGRRYRLTE